MNEKITHHGEEIIQKERLVLVIEDDSGWRRTIQLTYGRSGVEVIAVASVEEAQQVIKS